MAEAAVSFAVERLRDLLISDLLISEAKLLNGVIGQIKKVKRELERMECFLEEADKKQNRDKRVRQWVAEIRVLAFRIEDVIETFAMEVATKPGFKGMLRKFALVSRHNIATELNDIEAELTNLTTCLQTYGISNGLGEGQTSNSQVDLKSRRITYSHDIEKDFVGMEKEIEQLISDLKKKDMEVVVSICGMGGQGKTTLAKKLYNHAQVKPHFQAFAWVCITQQFEREEILKGVLKQLLPGREEDVSKMDDAKLVKELSNVQLEKNCFIVIDDLWKVEHWESLRPAFPITSDSKILLTTRDENVAKIGSVHKIYALTEDEGWQLLSKKAGINDLPEKKVALETIGRTMVERCKGLPLAIASLGGILKGKSLTDWEKINKDISHYLSKGERVTNDDEEYYTVKYVLGLSYDSLPPRLRHCFLCFANYKEDEEIMTEELYMFWMAEGLISVEDKAEGEMMLDVAERYLDELAHRSLVQVEKYDEVGESWSKNRTCRVHDLIRDMCLSKVKEEKVIHVIHSQRKPEDESKANKIRRLCIRSSEDGDESMLEPYDQDVISHIRSLLVWKDSNGYRFGVWLDKILSLKKFKLLRVLTASGYQISKENIRSITELVYLKYLCLRECWLKELPSSIGNLRNLETLDLRVIYSISVANVLWKLEQLKHLYLPDFFEVKGFRVKKLRLKGLNKLEVIHNYESGHCDAHDLIQLPKLKVLSGSIVVEDNLTGNNIIDYIKSRELRHSRLEIIGKGRLCLVLLLECCFIDDLKIRSPICRFPKEYDHTRFSGRLTRLQLNYCRMEEDPMILLEKLVNLRTLYLYTDAYLKAEMVCSAKGFPKLETLDLKELPNLRNWRVDEGAMPNLSFLEIYKCRELEMLPEGLIYLTALQTLLIEDMPRTFKNRIEGAEGEDFYKVRHIPKVTFDRKFVTETGFGGDESE